MSKEAKSTDFLQMLPKITTYCCVTKPSTREKKDLTQPKPICQPIKHWREISFQERKVLVNHESKTSHYLEGLEETIATLC